MTLKGYQKAAGSSSCCNDNERVKCYEIIQNVQCSRMLKCFHNDMAF